MHIYLGISTILLNKDKDADADFFKEIYVVDYKSLTDAAAKFKEKKSNKRGFSAYIKLWQFYLPCIHFPKR